jgi:hypothetical protein
VACLKSARVASRIGAMSYAFAKAYMNDALWILPAPAEVKK